MILVDTSIWIDHFRTRDDSLSRLLADENVLIHPFIIGELALGFLRDRQLLLQQWSALPLAPIVSPNDVLHFISGRELFGIGIGYVDAHLLASLTIMDGPGLWTRDRRLSEVAGTLNIPRFFPQH